MPPGAADGEGGALLSSIAASPSRGRVAACVAALLAAGLLLACVSASPRSAAGAAGVRVCVLFLHARFNSLELLHVELVQTKQTTRVLVLLRSGLHAVGFAQALSLDSMQMFEDCCIDESPFENDANNNVPCTQTLVSFRYAGGSGVTGHRGP